MMAFSVRAETLEQSFNNDDQGLMIQNNNFFNNDGRESLNCFMPIVLVKLTRMTLLVAKFGSLNSVSKLFCLFPFVNSR